ncbi:hypothetical protein ACPF7I_00970 [Anoxybacillus sp. D401a]|uniref:hypothetical protein n=1 Tax=Anoxybacillus sp. D401a TaxID=575112 RepID=UPI003D336DD2
MLKKNLFTSPLAAILATFVLGGTTAAETIGDSTSWSYSNYNNGSYVPRTGSLKSYFGYDGFYYIRTESKFTLDSYNVSQIKEYNNGGDNPGTSCDNSAAYFTVDMTAVPDNSLDLEISAYVSTTNLPDPKFDFETDGGVDNQESEVVALGTVASQQYFFTTNWEDFRDGDSGDSGEIQLNFAMSKKGFVDYNNCINGGGYRAITYGDNLGRP